MPVPEAPAPAAAGSTPWVVPFRATGLRSCPPGLLDPSLWTTQKEKRGDRAWRSLVWRGDRWYVMFWRMYEHVVGVRVCEV